MDLLNHIEEEKKDRGRLIEERAAFRKNDPAFVAADNDYRQAQEAVDLATKAMESAKEALDATKKTNPSYMTYGARIHYRDLAIERLTKEAEKQSAVAADPAPAAETTDTTTAPTENTEGGA